MSGQDFVKRDSRKEPAVLYQDAHIVVAFKSAGMAAQQERGFSEDMESWLKKKIPAARDYLGIVHRLDKPVSGILVYALEKKSAADLSGQVKDGRMTKIYEAAVYGVFDPPDGLLSDFLLEDKRKNVTAAVKEGTEGARKAVLVYRTLAVRGDGALSLLQIELKTGRRHQIRVQMSHAGHPVCGDRKYGGFPGAADDAFPDICLCACELTFIHPATGEKMHFAVHPAFRDIFTGSH